MPLGVLMLDTHFTRFPGDIGHRDSHGWPVLFARVPQATVRHVIGGISALVDPAERREALEPFLRAGEGLVAQGARALTTSCGFLAAYQRELSAHFDVPVMASALCLLPDISQTLPPGQRIGVMTFDAKALLPAHFAAVGYEATPAIVGLAPGCAFQHAIRDNCADDSIEQRNADVTEAAARLAQHADLGAVVLECTNFPPHRAQIERMFPCRIYDIWDVVRALTGHARAA